MPEEVEEYQPQAQSLQLGPASWAALSLPVAVFYGVKNK